MDAWQEISLINLLSKRFLSAQRGETSGTHKTYGKLRTPLPQPGFPLPPFPMWLPPSHFPPRQVSPSGEAHFPPSKFPLPPPDLPPSPFPRSPHARCNGRAGASRTRRSRSDNEPAASSTSQKGELDPRGKVAFPRDSSPAVFPLLARIRWPMERSACPSAHPTGAACSC